MKKININVQEPYYSCIINGSKTIEGRLNKGKFATIEKGDIVLLGEKEIPFLVAEKTIYDTFEQMIYFEGIKNVMPDKKDTAEVLKVYYKYYTPEQENKFGVVAIKIKKSTQCIVK